VAHIAKCNSYFVFLMSITDDSCNFDSSVNFANVLFVCLFFV